MTQTHAVSQQRSADSPPAVHRAAEHEADRFAAYATTGRAAGWSFGAVPTHSDPVGPALAARLTEPGAELDTVTARTLAPGQDVSDVRVHTGLQAAALTRDLHADAVTIGRDIAFAPGHFDTRSQRGRHLLAHELGHAVQHRDTPLAVHRKEAGERTGHPAQADYADFVDEAIKYLDSATEHYRALARVANAPQAPGGPAPMPGTPPPGLPVDRLPEALDKLQKTYESSREILDQQLSGDTARTERLRRAYVNAAGAARVAVVGMPRANLIIIAAPKDATDGFITNATSYAKMYYGKPRDGSVVSMIEQVDTVEALFDAVEKADPTRMIGRVDIFCHGTIDPVHMLKLGTVWHRVADFKQVADARAGRAATLATQARFDPSTTIELHACRLGAAMNEPTKPSAEAPTTGTEFLTGFGSSLGGEQGQTVTGYRQRWVPRVFRLPGVTTTKGLKGAALKSFQRIAVQTYDAVMAGSTEVHNLLTDAELSSGVVTQQRKIALMTDLYNAGKGWIIGHQYTGANPVSTDPVRDVKGRRDTFSSEKDWQGLTLTVQVPGQTATTAGGRP